MKKILIFLLFILVIILNIFPIECYDIWTHLTTGKYILSHLEIPKTDIYSYTATDRPWLNHEWLFQVLVYLVYKIFDYNGIIVFKSIIIFLAFLFLFKTVYKPANLIVTSVITLLTLYMSHIRFFERPEIFTMLFLAIYIFILFRYKYKQRNFIYLLPFLQVLWVNIHAYFILGLLLIWIFILGEVTSQKIPLPLKWSQDNRIEGKRLKRLILIALLATLACFINPNGSKGAVLPILTSFKLTGESGLYLKGVAELTPAYSLHVSPIHMFIYQIIIALCSISFLLNIKRLNINFLFLYFIFYALGLIAIRNVAIFAFVAMPITIHNIDNFFEEFPDLAKKFKIEKLENKINVGLHFVLILIVLILIFSFIAGKFYDFIGTYRNFGLGINEKFPTGALQFIKENNIKGNMFNQFGIGGYFLWNFYPEQKVFMDGRVEIYGDELFSEYEKCHTNFGIWKNLERKFNFEYIFIDQYAMERYVKLLYWLFKDKEWKLVYLDEKSLIFVKNLPKYKDLINKCELEFDEPTEDAILKNFSAGIRQKRFFDSSGIFPIEQLKRAYFFMAINKDKNAVLEFQKALEINPNLANAYQGLGSAYFNLSYLDKALSCYERALELQPKWKGLRQSIENTKIRQKIVGEAIDDFKKKQRRFPAKDAKSHFLLGNIYSSKGLLREAMKEYEKVISLNPRFKEAHSSLAHIYFQLEWNQDAIEMCNKYLELDKKSAEIYNLLGTSYGGMGFYKEAEENFKKAIELKPDYAEPCSNLGVIYVRQERFDDAIKMWEKSLELDPNYTPARQFIEMAKRDKALKLKKERKKEWFKRLLRPATFGGEARNDGRYRHCEERSDEAISIIIQPCFAEETDFSGKKKEPPIAIKKPQKQLQVGENFTYKVRWMGVPVGYATLEVKEIATLNNYRCYHFVSKAYSNKFLSRFYRLEDIVHSYADVNDFKTIRFEKYQQEGRYRADEQIDFDHKNKKATYKSLLNKSQKTVSIPYGIKDPLGVFYYFRLQDVEVGKRINLEVFVDEKAWELEIEVLGTEKKELLRKGVFDCFVAEPLAKFKGLFVKRGRVLAYFTVDEKRIPVIIEMHTPYGRVTGTLDKTTK